ncbi:7-deoxyloganetin glucosyltransferase-like [Oryza brachyantha]|uniref:7-deoxyloganetin glucosyltransferase-like n=1 Tax=Oryza brachyantha TaxID=4533 RepID=UPI001ADC586A|nr:7-deoxyloganetin glucosyltransferase-like [Oryza brachyantha]
MASPEPGKPHVLLLPYPAQGHVTPFLKLAKALHARSFHVTFVNTEYNHARLVRTRGPAAVAGAGGLRFETIPDGLPPPPPGAADATQDIWALCEATRRTGPGHVRELVERLGRAGGGVPPVSCVVADGAMGFAVHVAREMGIPGYLFFTPSACGLLAYLNFDQLVKRGYVPFKDESCFTNGYLDTRLDWVAGMIAGVRLRDFPTFIRTTDADDVMVTINIKQSELDAPAADGILLNTFDDLERAALDAILARLPNTFTVGPLGPEVSPASYLPSLTSSLWKEDDRCAAWLDGHADGAVLYVNFGSITVMTREQIGEFARGLAAAGSPFLWVVRPDMVRDAGDGAPLLPEGFEEEVVAGGRGLMVGWCDQEAVLRHRATGGFLSHCGWNSTLESLVAGVPLLCWPFFSEQVTNCRYACEEWGVGVEMAREAGRREVEAAVKELMGGGERAAAMRRRASEWKEKAAAAVAPGGSSQRNLESFVAEIARVKR